jgi:hypothetical protein
MAAARAIDEQYTAEAAETAWAEAAVNVREKTG